MKLSLPRRAEKIADIGRFAFAHQPGIDVKAAYAILPKRL